MRGGGTPSRAAAALQTQGKAPRRARAWQAGTLAHQARAPKGQESKTRGGREARGACLLSMREGQLPSLLRPLSVALPACIGISRAPPSDTQARKAGGTKREVGGGRGVHARRGRCVVLGEAARITASRHQQPLAAPHWHAAPCTAPPSAAQNARQDKGGPGSLGLGEQAGWLLGAGGCAGEAAGNKHKAPEGGSR